MRRPTLFRTRQARNIKSLGDNASSKLSIKPKDCDGPHKNRHREVNLAVVIVRVAPVLFATFPPTPHAPIESPRRNQLHPFASRYPIFARNEKAGAGNQETDSRETMLTGKSANRQQAFFATTPSWRQIKISSITPSLRHCSADRNTSFFIKSRTLDFGILPL